MKSSFLLFAMAVAVVVTLTSCNTLDPDEPGALVPPTVDEDASLPSIFVNGTHLHSEAYGNPNDPLIMVLHGGPGGDYRSLLNCSRFSEDGFYVAFYDQRGSGLSRRHNKEIYTTQLFIDDLHAVIEYYVNEYAGDVNGLVLMEPGGFTWHDAEEYIKRCRSMELFGETSNDYLYLDQFLTGSDHNELDYKAAVQAAADFSKGNKVGNPGPYPIWRKGAVCSAAAYEYVRDHPFDFTTNLHQFTTRVLFVYSELNEAYGTAHAQLVSSAYPNVELVEIGGTGHEVPYFGWDRFYPIARTYLNSIR
jgi:proline iminopeptidase